MQSIFNLSKYLVIVAVLTLALLTTWYNDEAEVISLVQPSSYSYSSESASTGKGNSGDSIWRIMSREFELDTKAQSAQVQAEIRKLLAEPGRLYSILKSALPYIYFIHEQTKARGLPAEIALIPVIESEFNPYDHSKKGATGLWQLMKVTAHELGVNVSSGYDGRRNVVASTKAALAYFNDLGKFFNGNWYLAIAAYNCGQFRVKSAIRHAGTNSFWSLSLPQETKFYVPRLLAVAAIVKNPEKYGVQLPHVDNQPYFKEVPVTKPVNLNKVAKTAGVNVDTLNKLNPDFTRGSYPKKEVASLLVPADKAVKIKTAI
jgi:membrane-bound lytic murein transglycosylase D